MEPLLNVGPVGFLPATSPEERRLSAPDAPAEFALLLGAMVGTAPALPLNPVSSAESPSASEDMRVPASRSMLPIGGIESPLPVVASGHISAAAEEGMERFVQDERVSFPLQQVGDLMRPSLRPPEAETALSPSLPSAPAPSDVADAEPQGRIEPSVSDRVAVSGPQELSSFPPRKGDALSRMTVRFIQQAPEPPEPQVIVPMDTVERPTETLPLLSTVLGEESTEREMADMGGGRQVTFPTTQHAAESQVLTDPRVAEVPAGVEVDGVDGAEGPLPLPHGRETVVVRTPVVVPELFHWLGQQAPSLKDGHYLFRFQLRPPQLGEVHVELRVEGRAIQALLRVASAEVKQLLEAASGQLGQQLAQSGFQLMGFTVNADAGGSPRQRELWEEVRILMAERRVLAPTKETLPHISRYPSPLPGYTHMR